jgi:hypothetical protein
MLSLFIGFDASCAHTVIGRPRGRMLIAIEAFAANGALKTQHVIADTKYGRGDHAAWSRN